MPSPITSADFDITVFGSDICERLRKLLEINNTLKTFFEWFLSADGSEVSAEFKAMIQDIATPTGALIWRPVSAVPAGYLVANGQAVDRTTYANLYAVYQDTFGAGNGTTTFNLPNMQSRFALGTGAAGLYPVASTGGTEGHELTAAELPAHTHGMPTDSLAIRTTLDQNTVGDADNASPGGGGGLVGRATFVSVGSGQEHNNMPPYMSGLWLVKT